MLKRSVLLAAAVVIFGVACQVPEQHEAGSATAQKSTLMDELKYSKFCTEAAEKFWTRHDWKDRHDVGEIASYTSHYNKRLKKCLVDVHAATLVKGKVLESDHVYDALENTVVAGRVLLKKQAGPDGEVEKLLLIKDGSIIRDKREAAAFLPRFQSLMIG